jgi:hypothetical protein
MMSPCNPKNLRPDAKSIFTSGHHMAMAALAMAESNQPSRQKCTLPRSLPLYTPVTARSLYPILNSDTVEPTLDSPYIRLHLNLQYPIG